MNSKKPWIYQLYFPVTLGRLKKGESHISASFPFYPTSAVNCREVLKLIGVAQEAVMKEVPQKAAELPGASAAYRSPFMLYGWYSQDGHRAKSPLKLPWGREDEREPFFLVVVKWWLECPGGFMMTHIPLFPCKCWQEVGVGDSAQEDIDTLTQPCTTV